MQKPHQNESTVLSFNVNAVTCHFSQQSPRRRLGKAAPLRGPTAVRFSRTPTQQPCTGGYTRQEHCFCEEFLPLTVTCMPIELDHVFVCTAADAPEAEKLVQFGLREAPPNQHLGQGTACRRFSFLNAMIELFWVSDEREAQNPTTRRTLLWQRWVGRQGNTCPFGICVRPVDPQESGPPFPAWDYRPAYLPDPLVMHIGEAGVDEPMWIYLGFMRRLRREQWFIEHPVGIRKITGLTLTTPKRLHSLVSQKVIESGILAVQAGPIALLEIEFDGNRRNERVDFRPHLPLVFQL